MNLQQFLQNLEQIQTNINGTQKDYELGLECSRFHEVRWRLMAAIYVWIEMLFLVFCDFDKLQMADAFRNINEIDNLKFIIWF